VVFGVIVDAPEVITVEHGEKVPSSGRISRPEAGQIQFANDFGRKSETT